MRACHANSGGGFSARASSAVTPGVVARASKRRPATTPSPAALRAGGGVEPARGAAVHARLEAALRRAPRLTGPAAAVTPAQAGHVLSAGARRRAHRRG